MPPGEGTTGRTSSAIWELKKALLNTTGRLEDLIPNASSPTETDLQPVQDYFPHARGHGWWKGLQQPRIENLVKHIMTPSAGEATVPTRTRVPPGEDGPWQAFLG